MSKKVDKIVLGDYTTRDRVEVDIRIDVDSGEFDAHLNNKQYKDTSLKTLKETLKEEHRRLHATVDWVKAIKVNPTKGTAEVCFAAIIGDNIYTNEVAERDGKEKNFLHLSYDERKQSISLPRSRQTSMDGNIHLLPHDDETMALLNGSMAKLGSIREQYKAALEDFVAVADARIQSVPRKTMEAK